MSDPIAVQRQLRRLTIRGRISLVISSLMVAGGIAAFVFAIAAGEGSTATGVGVILVFLSIPALIGRILVNKQLRQLSHTLGRSGPDQGPDVAR